MHLCAPLAWTRALLGEPPAGDDRSIVDYLISDMTVLRAFVMTAQSFEEPLLASTKLKVPRERLALVRWIDAQVHRNPFARTRHR